MSKSAVFHKNSFVGEVEIYPKNTNSAVAREIRISHFSPPSDRCPPLAVLHTIAGAAGAAFRMESRSPSPELYSLYSVCLGENKTAVVASGEGELHLVAMPSRKNLIQHSCFWGYMVAPGLYNSCLVMLNLRCLGIVFDLDETLIVANTTRSFEDRINNLQAKLITETDPQRVTGMMAEVKRYQDDKSILKQYVDNDQVVDNGRVFRVQSEVVQPISDNHQPITRPIIRLQERNIILTRVNPAIRDTSVLVRLRPAWEDLRSYLTARGRKRFEVYVCTMAERDYALEMWRLLDPESNLINSKELLDRIVCVKPGTKKSLLNVFQDGNCHPKMALVIDDRLKVWDEKDQPRVHVVPAFAPYYAPQAEANNNIPVLCVARNVACNARGSFFKEFDEGILPRIIDVFYEDEMMVFPSAPDVGNYLISEDDVCASNGNKDPLGFEGMADVEVERRLKEANCSVQAIPPRINNFEPRPMSSFQHVLTSSSAAVPLAAPQVMMPLPNNQCSQSIFTSKTLGPSGLSEPSLQCSTTEEGEVPESDLDPNTRRRLLILQHGQDMREPPPPPPPSFQFRPPLQVSVPPMQPRGSWLPLEEDINPRQLNKAPNEFPREQEVLHFDRSRSQRPSFFPAGENSIPSDRVLHENQRMPVEVHYGDVRTRSSRPISNYNAFPGEEMPMRRNSSNHRDAQFDSGGSTPQYAESPGVALRDIVMKSGGGKVEFRTGLCDTAELQFSVEAWLVGDKIGEGIGRTRKEAQHQAVMSSLRTLANKYMTNALSDPIAVRGDVYKLHVKENGFVSDSYGYSAFNRNDSAPVASTSDTRPLSHNLEGPIKSRSFVAALQELCTMEGYSLAFQAQLPPPGSSVNQGEVSAQVEIQGQILGKGIGTTWEDAKLQAAKEAHESLISMLGQFTQKRSCSPRSQPITPNKRLKQDFVRGLQNSIL
ncbi:RNA polymerase II C-terminal domain phosphatase-like 1 [Iris pallida]|uniref:protein-serine/threonine phosphatase n=1 Tax=Iris pallida TaxID=29817 RepID=A0AAX6HFZ6_IRIPA|nr:RNA polymerase II C-terminal domain phosphatase-like 1 [Iris pallida]